MANLKRIPLKNLYNCRDLGGYACADGKMISYHKLCRADVPAALDAGEWQKLYDYGVRTVIDLRSYAEQKMASYQTPEGIEQISFPMQQYESEGKSIADMSEEEMVAAAGAQFGKSLADGYSTMIESGADAVAAILNLIAGKVSDGAVLFHCTAGKDRTGVTAALLYFLCGVEDSDIIADYQVTYTYQAANPLFVHVPPDFEALMNSDAANMSSFLQAVREKDYLSLLYAHGLKKENVEKLKAAVTEVMP